MKSERQKNYDGWIFDKENNDEKVYYNITDTKVDGKNIYGYMIFFDANHDIIGGSAYYGKKEECLPLKHEIAYKAYIDNVKYKK